MEKLKELAQLTPGQIWAKDEYKQRQASEKKIMVDCENADKDPERVLAELEAYIRIPKRKPYLLKSLLRRIRIALKLEVAPEAKEDK